MRQSSEHAKLKRSSTAAHTNVTFRGELSSYLSSVRIFRVRTWHLQKNLARLPLVTSDLHPFDCFTMYPLTSTYLVTSALKFHTKFFRLIVSCFWALFCPGHFIFSLHSMIAEFQNSFYRAALECNENMTWSGQNNAQKHETINPTNYVWNFNALVTK